MPAQSGALLRGNPTACWCSGSWVSLANPHWAEASTDGSATAVSERLAELLSGITVPSAGRRRRSPSMCWMTYSQWPVIRDQQRALAADRCGRSAGVSASAKPTVNSGNGWHCLGRALAGTAIGRAPCRVGLRVPKPLAAGRQPG